MDDQLKEFLGGFDYPVLDILGNKQLAAAQVRRVYDWSTSKSVGITNKELEFLQQSNYIEGEYTDEFLLWAIKAWEYMKSNDKLTLNVIKKAHRILMTPSDLKRNDKGEWRKCDAWIGKRKCPAWECVADSMDAWIDVFGGYYDGNVTRKEIESAHIDFEGVHPFVDGNGRIGRMIMLWQYVKAGLPIKVIYAKDRGEYYKLFRGI